MGVEVEVASGQVGVDPRHVRDLTFVPLFREMCDAYRDQSVRESAYRAAGQLREAVDVGEMEERAARLHRQIQAAYREVRAGDRERKRQQPRKTSRQRRQGTAHRSFIEVEEEQPKGIEIGGDVHGESSEDAD